jgi:hypothetical protein
MSPSAKRHASLRAHIVDGAFPTVFPRRQSPPPARRTFGTEPDEQNVRGNIDRPSISAISDTSAPRLTLAARALNGQICFRAYSKES